MKVGQTFLSVLLIVLLPQYRHKKSICGQHVAAWGKDVVVPTRFRKQGSPRSQVCPPMSENMVKLRTSLVKLR